MSIQIKETNQITDEQYQRLFCWDEDPFNSPSKDLKWRKKEYSILVYNNNDLMSHIGLLNHSINLPNETLIIGGVGSVITIPEAQGQGYATAGLKYSVDYIKEKYKADFGILVCNQELVPFYEKLGWKLLPPPIYFDQPEGKIKSQLEVMYLKTGDKEWNNEVNYFESFPW